MFNLLDVFVSEKLLPLMFFVSLFLFCLLFFCLIYVSYAQNIFVKKE